MINGILFQQNASTLSRLSVSNTLVSDNGGNGIFINTADSGTTNGVLNHVEMENNGLHGLFVQTETQTINLTVSDSVSANNGMAGVFSNSDGPGVLVTVRNSTIANNLLVGLAALGTGTGIRVTRSAITGNNVGWSGGGGGAIQSYADNNIDGNGSVNSEPPGPLPYH
jgi:hypothetical protein